MVLLAGGCMIGIMPAPSHSPCTGTRVLEHRSTDTDTETGTDTGAGTGASVCTPVEARNAAGSTTCAAMNHGLCVVWTIANCPAARRRDGATPSLPKRAVYLLLGAALQEVGADAADDEADGVIQCRLLCAENGHPVWRTLRC